MGSPASLSPTRLTELTRLAADIIASVDEDRVMPHGLDRIRTRGGNVFYERQTESLLLEMAQVITALSDNADRAAERLLFCMHIYRGYKIGESRGPNGCLFDAIDALRPDIAAELHKADVHDVYVKHFDENGATP